MRYAFVREHAARFPVTRLRALLLVSTSGYYDLIGRPESATAQCHRDLGVKVRATHAARQGRYGSHWVRAEPSAGGRSAASTQWPRR